jgi:hypothetical protein
VLSNLYRAGICWTKIANQSQHRCYSASIKTPEKVRKPVLDNDIRLMNIFCLGGTLSPRPFALKSDQSEILGQKCGSKIFERDGGNRSTALGDNKIYGIPDAYMGFLIAAAHSLDR